MMSPFQVSLREDKGDTELTLFFYCMADDMDHAAEQAMEAYPNGELEMILECDEEEYLYHTRSEKMAHTPGPWKAEGFAVGDRAEHLYLTQDEDHHDKPIRICLIAGHEWKVPKGKREERCYYTESSVADARLIAAAPDMLAMLHRLEDLPNRWDEDEPLWDELRALIAKATGQEK